MRVVLARRRVTGWVVSLDQPTTDRDPPSLSPLIAVTGPAVAPDVVELSQWAAHRFAGPRRAILAAAAAPRVQRHRLAPRRFAPVQAWRDLADDRAVKMLRAGGGLLWWPPSWDVMAVIAAAALRGPTLVVVPSRDQADVLTRRARRAGASVACLPEDWAAAAGGVDLVIGSRAAVWGPCADLAAIVVVDEHDESLIEERSPTWNAVAVAEERARRSRVPLIVTSPCPSVTSVVRFKASTEDPEASARAAWPAFEIVDVDDRAPWDRFSVTDELRRHLADPSRRVVCVTNITGRARILACRGCASVVRCEHCGAAVAQDRDGTLVCRRCSTTRPPICTVCLGTTLAVVRAGIARLEQDLAAAARGPVASITASETRLVSSPLYPSGPTDAADARVFVGTEAVLHRVRRAETVAFVDLDSELLAPRYRAGEHALALVARAARIVGPRTSGGRILVQTAMPDHEMFTALALGAPQRLVGSELERRRVLGFPPFGALATLEGPGLGDETSRELLERWHEVVAASDATLRGPVVDRWMLQAPDSETLAGVLAHLERPPKSRIKVVVDPPRV